ncbi:MAG: hypothetical protein IJX30_01400 [Clostridia bacterium]|nr:hypothetical protein [Clostridia bacterium]
MKTLKCEMCGSVDLVKQDGLFVCQYCGTKYSLEEAKKMMVEVEGTVEVQGTVQVDNSSYVEKYLANARRAKAKEDWSEVEKYYNLVEQNDPTNIEAIFYSAYGKAKMSLIDADRFKRENAFSVLANCISIIDDNFDVTHEEENRKVIQQINNDIMNMRKSYFVFNQRVENGIVTNDSIYTYKCFDKISLSFCESLENIIKNLTDSKVKAEYYFMALSLVQQIMSGKYSGSKKEAKSLVDKYSAALQQLIPEQWNALIEKEKREKEEKIERIKNNPKNNLYSKWGLIFMLISFLLIIIPVVNVLQGYNDEDSWYYEDLMCYVLAIISLIGVGITCAFSYLSYINKTNLVFPFIFVIFGSIIAYVSILLGIVSGFAWVSVILQIVAVIFAILLIRIRRNLAKSQDKGVENTP